MLTHQPVSQGASNRMRLPWLRPAFMHLAALAVCGLAIYVVWGWLGLPTDPNRTLWRDIPRQQNWRFFFSLWVPVSLASLQAAACVVLSWRQRRLEVAPLALSLAAIPLWAGAVAICRWVPDWFLCLSLLYMVQVALGGGAVFLSLRRGFSTNHQLAHPRTPLTMAAFLFFTLLPLAGWINSAISTCGDEMVYLINAHSILADGDLDLANQAQPKIYQSFYWGGWHASFVSAEAGNWRFPSLLLPAYALGGRLGVLIFLCLWGAASGAFIFLAGREITGDSVASCDGVGLAAMSLPFLLPCLHVYPEVIGAGTLAAALWQLSRTDDELVTLVLTVLGSAVLLAFIKGRYLGLSCALFIMLIIKIGKWRQVLLACAAGGALLGIAFAFMKVELLGRGYQIVHLVTSVGLLAAVQALAGLFLDQEVGLLFFSPIYIFSLTGLILMGRNRRWALFLCLCPLIIYLAELTFIAPHFWDAGFTFPTRFLAILLPCFALPLVQYRASTPGGVSRAIFNLTALVTLCLSIITLAWPELMHTRLEGANTIFVRLYHLTGWDISGFFPSLTSTKPQSGLGHYFDGVTLAWAAVALLTAVALAFGKPLQKEYSRKAQAILGALLGLTMAGIITLFWCSSAKLYIRGASMDRRDATNYRHMQPGESITFLALQPGGGAWAQAKLPAGQSLLRVVTLLPKSLEPPPDGGKHETRYDPQACLLLDGKLLERWRVLQDPDQGVRKPYRTQFHDIHLFSQGNTGRLEISYCGGGWQRKQYLGLESISVK